MRTLSKIGVFCALIGSVASVIPAHGFALQNVDLTTYWMEVVEDIDIKKTHEIELFQWDGIYDLCATGCLVRLNGMQYKFKGHENLIIRNGELIDIASQ